MKIHTEILSVKSKGETQLTDITSGVRQILQKSGLKEGIITVSVKGSTAGITSIEYEPGLLKDYPEFWEKIVPEKNRYHHDDTWHDGNGHSHVRAALQGSSFQTSVVNGALFTGTWQQIILIDFDNRPRQREIAVTLIGE
ncbi:MAG: hypothetical protein FMNOHCHN_00699 [Ignavibacteriaceae bacterium]|nr:hypothetical protein [Ignavibacteriaceae bacterium]MCK6615108.1 secondary thiamine-phosphate synthase enzyme YjbQ [Ignavibacteriaceae bacterium]